MVEAAAALLLLTLAALPAASRAEEPVFVLQGEQGPPGEGCGCTQEQWDAAGEALRCLADCPELREGSCALWGCTGPPWSCGPVGSLAGACGVDEICNGESGECEWNGTVCGGVVCPDHPLGWPPPVCNPQGKCEYRPGGVDPVQAEQSAEIFVPPGAMMMGSPPDEGGREADEGPIHLVLFGRGFFIGKYEVTVARYELCQQVGLGCTEPSAADWSGAGWGVNRSSYPDGRAGRADHPQNGLTLEQARVFCATSGARLPSEAEWEYAASGPVHRRYPWGEAEADCTRAVFDEDGSGTRPWGCDGCAGDGCSGTKPVGAAEAGVAWSGALDMAGNVWEWTLDGWHGSYTGAPGDGSAWSPDFPAGISGTIRGGTFASAARELRTSRREANRTSQRAAFLGARCARSLP